MADEHEIPIKVVDRRWWARADEGGAAHGGTSPKPTYVEELERKLAESEARAQEYLSKYRQASREFDDARARVRKELAKDAERSRREVLVSLLDIVDNLDRAIDAAEKTARLDSEGTAAAVDDPLLQGVQMVRQQFLSKLDGFGIRRIACEGAVFDPLLHEAVTTIPAANPSEEGRIAGVIRSGYTIGDEVLRPALVAVHQALIANP
jgi:molecular chaperone GrpE